MDYNEIVKGKDAEISRLNALIDAGRAEYERLKQAVFYECRKARYKVIQTKAVHAYAEQYERMLGILEKAGLEEEYDQWYINWLSGEAGKENG